MPVKDFHNNICINLTTKYPIINNYFVTRFSETVCEKFNAKYI